MQHPCEIFQDVTYAMGKEDSERERMSRFSLFLSYMRTARRVCVRDSIRAAKENENIKVPTRKWKCQLGRVVSLLFSFLCFILLCDLALLQEQHQSRKLKSLESDHSKKTEFPNFPNFLIPWTLITRENENSVEDIPRLIRQEQQATVWSA